jgi:hypothetical protein
MIWLGAGERRGEAYDRMRALSALIATPVFAQGASTDAKTPGSVDEDLGAQGRAAGEKMGMKSTKGTKGTVGATGSATHKGTVGDSTSGGAATGRRCCETANLQSPCGLMAQSSKPPPRLALMSPRRFLLSSRRCFDAKVGRVARRGVGRTMASRSISSRRSIAS